MACYSPVKGVYLKNCPPGQDRGVAVPCGRCIGCRIEYARQWAVRCMHEAKVTEENMFITLTYDDDSMPWVCDEVGLLRRTLSKRDIQNFLKRLRKMVAPKRIRYLISGEYGETFGRPHYHGIIFGHEFADKKLLRNGTNKLYTSDQLQEAWGNGFSNFGGVTFDSANYVAKYVLKKIKGDKEAEHYGGREKEFMLMSRVPPIGSSWLERFGTDVYPSDQVIVRGRDTRPPRAYDKWYEKNNPEGYAALKERRKRDAERLNEYVTGSGTYVNIPENRNYWRLKVKEEVLRAKVALKSKKLED